MDIPKTMVERSKWWSNRMIINKPIDQRKGVGEKLKIGRTLNIWIEERREFEKYIKEGGTL